MCVSISATVGLPQSEDNPQKLGSLYRVDPEYQPQVARLGTECPSLLSNLSPAYSLFPHKRFDEWETFANL